MPSAGDKRKKLLKLPVLRAYEPVQRGPERPIQMDNRTRSAVSGQPRLCNRICLRVHK